MRRPSVRLGVYLAVVLAVLAPATVALFVRIDAFERLVAVARRHERYELDEALLAATVVAVVGLVVYALAQSRRLEAAREQVEALQELVPVCSGCARIRIAGGSWREGDLGERAGATVAHTVCPSCLRALERARL